MEWHQVGDIFSVCFGEYEIGLIYSNLTIDKSFDMMCVFPLQKLKACPPPTSSRNPNSVGDMYI